MNASTVTRSDVEEFLYREAAMLDRWQLDQWLALYTDDAIYHVPTIGTAPETGPENHAVLHRRRPHAAARARHPPAEKGRARRWPRSRTRHLVTKRPDRRALGVRAAGLGGVRGAPVQERAADVYVGSYRYRLAITAEGLRIREKRSMIDMDALRPHGRVSILL
jgi:p-cumate 2,3-dioxygenase beta subunit